MLNTRVTVKPLDIERDVAQCVELMVTSEPWITLGARRESVLAALTDPGKEVYAIHDAKGVTGFVVVDMRGLPAGYIQILAVRPDCRGQGLGSTLIEWAEDRIFRDSPNAFICVSSFNAGARRLYERLGFSLVGVLHDLFVRGHDELLLRKTRGTWTEFREAHGMKTRQ